MKQITANLHLAAVTVLTLFLSSCHISSPEPPATDENNKYTAYGVLTIPSSGFTKENVRTEIVLTKENTLDIYMYDVKFATMMPVTIDMVISGVGYNKTAKEIRFYGDSIVPTAGNKPYDKYIVTDLEGVITADSMFISNKYGETPSVYKGALKK